MHANVYTHSVEEHDIPEAPGAIRAWQFDSGNLTHLARHDLDAALVEEIAAGEPRFVQNAPKADRSGSHLMIGPSKSGRYWTVVITKARDVPFTWRAITGWPSTRKEERLYREQAES